MIKISNKATLLFSVSGSILFLRWGFLLVSMDAYLLNDPSSYLFWSIAITRSLLAIVLSSGLIAASLKTGQRYWPVSMMLVVLSMIGSLFIMPETLYWAYDLSSVVIHGYALSILYKNKDEAVPDYP